MFTLVLYQRASAASVTLELWWAWSVCSLPQGLAGDAIGKPEGEREGGPRILALPLLRCLEWRRQKASSGHKPGSYTDLDPVPSQLRVLGAA